MKLSAFIGMLLLTIAIAGLVVTNPGPDQYTRYMTDQAEIYLSQEVCTDLPAGLGGLLANQCAEVVQSIQPQLEPLIRDRTERLNFFIGSLYHTSIGLPELPMVPEYTIETIGIVNRFIPYRAARSA